MESYNILSWKGPMSISESNAWLQPGQFTTETIELRVLSRMRKSLGQLHLPCGAFSSLLLDRPPHEELFSRVQSELPITQL